MGIETKLGTIITGDHVGRDAVHVAVIEVVAAHNLEPGERVCLVDDADVNMILPEVCAPRGDDTTVGIIDPFIRVGIKSGQRCLLWLYPNTVTGMRHHWSHPAFKGGMEEEEESGSDSLDKAVNELEDAMNERLFIESIANRCGKSMQALLEDARSFSNGSFAIIDNSMRYEEVTDDEWERFWIWFERTSGKSCEKKWAPYTCSC